MFLGEILCLVAFLFFEGIQTIKRRRQFDAQAVKLVKSGSNSLNSPDRVIQPTNSEGSLEFDSEIQGLLTPADALAAAETPKKAPPIVFWAPALCDLSATTLLRSFFFLEARLFLSGQQHVANDSPSLFVE